MWYALSPLREQDLQNKPPKRGISGGSFFCDRQCADRFVPIPVRSEGRAEVEVGDGAFWTGESVGPADAEAEWNIEDTEIVDELSACG